MNKQQYTRNEEIANFATHGVGILLGVAAGVRLLIFSYTASTLYHACKEGKRKVSLRKFDHAAIYFHIAGTYTFFTLTVLRHAACWGWLLVCHGRKYFSHIGYCERPGEASAIKSKNNLR